MDVWVGWLREVSPVAAGVLVASVWQGVLLTGAVVLCLRVVGEVAPAVRSVIWSSVLLLVLALPVLGVLLPLRGAAEANAVHLRAEWGLALLGMWGAVSVYRAIRLGVHGLRLRRIAAEATPIPVDGAIRLLLTNSRTAQLCVSGEVNRPSVAGFWRPRILLPPGLVESLSRAELEQVILHEMEHLRRLDDWLNLFQQISLVILPLNPALLWLDRRLCQERELACDDGVLRATGARKAYAACLVKLAEDSLVRRGVSLALSALGTRAGESELVRRVRRILVSGESAGSGRKLRLVTGPLLAVAVGSTCLLARAPRVVSFDPAPQVFAEMQPAVDALGMTPVSAHPSFGRPTLVNAVMTSGRPAERRMLRVDVRRRTARTHRRTLARTGLREMTVWQPRVRLPQSAPPAPPAGPRAVLTDFEVAQPLYAAVPWRGGWLILQL